MLPSLPSGTVSAGLRVAALGALAVLLSACAESIGSLDDRNRSGAKPAFFVEGKQVVAEEGSRLSTLDGEILQYFNILLLVNKDAKGEYAQTMTVFRPEVARCGGCAWTASNVWDVSTGRELEEAYFTTTPTGVYQLDKKRFFREYSTTTWDGASMPFSMFWRYLEDGEETGWAVHAASPKLVKNLGKRNSGGCIRLHPTNAQALFEELQRDHTGQVPVFDWESRDGIVERREDGGLALTAGLKALLVVDDGEDLRYVEAEIPALGFELQDAEAD